MYAYIRVHIFICIHGYWLVVWSTEAPLIAAYVRQRDARVAMCIIRTRPHALAHSIYVSHSLSRSLVRSVGWSLSLSLCTVPCRVTFDVVPTTTTCRRRSNDPRRGSKLRGRSDDRVPSLSFLSPSFDIRWFMVPYYEFYVLSFLLRYETKIRLEYTNDFSRLISPFISNKFIS